MTRLLVGRRPLHERITCVLRLAAASGTHGRRRIFAVQQDGLTQRARAVVVQPRTGVPDTPEFSGKKLVRGDHDGRCRCT